MPADFNLVMDGDVFPINGQFEDSWRAVSESKDCKFVSDWFEEVIIMKQNDMRASLREGKYDEARAKEKYISALEDVILLIRQGISEGLKRSE